MPPTDDPNALAPVAPLIPGDPPVAMLIDYDGTISKVDVSELLLTRFFVADWHTDDVEYAEGRIGSRTFFRRQMPNFQGRLEDVVAYAEAQPHDPAFAGFVRLADELHVPVEVVSDGLGFFIAPALERLGVPDVSVVTSRTTFRDGRVEMTFPNGNPDCLVCGTCKRQRVFAHQAAGRAVVFVGDGESDRYAAAYSDLIFAKDELIDVCRSQGWEFKPWNDFDEVRSWLNVAVTAWRSDPASLPVHTSRPFICGPELWGPGRIDPPGPPQTPPKGPNAAR